MYDSRILADWKVLRIARIQPQNQGFDLVGGNLAKLLFVSVYLYKDFTLANTYSISDEVKGQAFPMVANCLQHHKPWVFSFLPFDLIHLLHPLQLIYLCCLVTVKMQRKDGFQEVRILQMLRGLLMFPFG
ncbi:hypothetical protein SLEP1_g39782 [Rubroshorea leprosula]|uniref:Uncharacterized protein n=1 Tax=Rubroshorea leprosula TaxID=152421 RepID=A0AAV5L1K3_9ROSI|nr:hypothetical protein SLEP1_g39782 [Rubroshorea leprosula]